MKVKITLGKALRQIKKINLRKRFMVKADSNGYQRYKDEIQTLMSTVIKKEEEDKWYLRFSGRRV
jgi:hypothetical protein